eukprot:TRINITY_DN16721_c0_g1_i4.p1 TRINITY_DN16721_c0_g1~~TRINITY_DN16721_c0_g1_i4.p1  ORF type:complete len:633 (-),score=172.38 TRINITY_DN16721_c0_g1_i4:15-1913(-)
MTSTTSTIPMSYIQGIEHKLVSRIVFGTLNLHKSDDPCTLLDTVYQSGCNAFDCAAIYGDGECEKILGKWIRERKLVPEDVFLVTKGGCGDESSGWSPSLQPEVLESHIRGSLERLGTPTVDLFMLHRDDPSMSVNNIVDTVNKFISAGLCKTWGVSNWEVDRIDDAINYANTSNQTPPVCDSLQMSLATPRRAVWPGTSYMDKERSEWYSVDKGVSVFAWESLAKGFMTGAWGDRAQLATLEQDRKSFEEDLTPNRDASWRQANLEDAYLSFGNVERRERAQQLAESKGATLAQIAVLYVLAQKIQPFVLIGTSNPAHWAANVDSSIKLSPEEALWLEEGGATKMSTQTLHCLSVQEDDAVEQPSAKKSKLTAVPPPSALHESLALSSSVRDHIAAGRDSILALAEGQDDRLMVLIGPCSVHCPKAAIDYAKWLLPLAQKHQNELVVVMRVYFEKPRTTVGWKGLISDPDMTNSFNVTKGLTLARALLLDCAEMGLLAGTEFLAPNTCDYFSDLVSYGAIGARTTESQCHREMASHLQMPVGFKNGTSGDVQVAADAITAAKASNTFLGAALDGQPAVITSEGNPCLLYTSDAADEEDSVDLGGRRIIKKKNDRNNKWAKKKIKRYRTKTI